MLIAFNHLRSRHHQRLAAVMLAVALCSLVLAAHSALADRHMGDDMAACLAIVQTAALALVLVITAITLTRPGILRPSYRHADSRWPQSLVRMQPSARSRAGPSVLQVFRC